MGAPPSLLELTELACIAIDAWRLGYFEMTATGKTRPADRALNVTTGAAAD
jgi:hypothetical protein